jgi:hypothetical protein
MMMGEERLRIDRVLPEALKAPLGPVLKLSAPSRLAAAAPDNQKGFSSIP